MPFSKKIISAKPNKKELGVFVSQQNKHYLKLYMLLAGNSVHTMKSIVSSDINKILTCSPSSTQNCPKDSKPCNL